MFNGNTGEITLCRSGLAITKDLTPSDLKRYIPDQIPFLYDTTTNYSHYCVWLNIDPTEFVYASVCFFGDTLDNIRLHPQYKTTALSDQRLQTMDLELERELAHAWYQKHFGNDKLVFDWGEVEYFPGSDPISGPPVVRIKYNRTELS